MTSAVQGKSRRRWLVVSAVAGLAFMVLAASAALLRTQSAQAATTVVYSAISNPLAPDVSGVGFEATATSEFGDYVHLGGTDRVANVVTVTMSSSAVYSDWASDSRYAGNSETWSHPITLNVYSSHLGANGVPDTLLISRTQSVAIPWRPAANPSCATPTQWKSSGGQCYDGMAFNATFDLSSSNVTLPNDVIVSIAFNTADYGTIPTHVAGPYNLLEVAAPTGQAVSAGSDDSTDKVFQKAALAASYHDGGAAGVGIFRQDAGRAPNGTVGIQITASSQAVSPAVDGVPTSIEQCKKGGWESRTDGLGNAFKNQGDCVSFVATGGKNAAAGD